MIELNKNVNVKEWRNSELDKNESFYDKNNAEKASEYTSAKVSDVLSKEQYFDHDDANAIFTNIDKNKIRSWFSTKSNGEINVDVKGVKNMIVGFSDIVEKGKLTQEIREKAQLIVDIFRGKEQLSHPAKFIEADLQDMEKDIVKIETYLKNHDGEQQYALAA